MPDTVVGREAELAAIAQFLTEVQAGPSALVLEGDSGIGKSTLWRAAATRGTERGFLAAHQHSGGGVIG